MTFKVKLVSQTNAIVLIVTGLVIFLVGAGTLLPPGGLHDESLSIMVMSIFAFIAYFLWQLFVTGRTVWTIDENEIKIVWTKTFIFAGSEDRVLKWSEIKNISRGSDPQYYNLKIQLASGTIIKYFHDTLTTRDDFEEMLKALYQTLMDKKTTANNSLAKAGLSNEN